MISVLIPFYNWDITLLVDDVLVSAKHLGNSSIEIIVCDDCSSELIYIEKIRRKFDGQIRIERNEKNLGRSRTRNKLIEFAKGRDIIFIDGDSRLYAPESYLTRYVLALQEHELVIGGTKYEIDVPADRQLRLHWNYGRRRESKTASERNKAPERYFFTNNFACRRALFDIRLFDEEITNYGYEDTDWSHYMNSKGVSVHHIDNYVMHKGLNSRQKFLNNADSAIQTLASWYELDKASSVYLLEFYRAQEISFQGKILLYLARLSQPLTRKLLETGFSNSLHLFDLYRLGRLAQLVCAK